MSPVRRVRQASPVSRKMKQRQLRRLHGFSCWQTGLRALDTYSRLSEEISGSWGLSPDGNLGGLLLAGQEGMSWSYVTPISVVLVDIEAKLDCNISLV